MAMDPVTPTKFYHRLIRKLLDGNVEHRLAEYEKISWVFSKLGGSWERVVKGSPKDVHLLKKIVRYATEHGHVTKKGSF